MIEIVTEPTSLRRSAMGSITGLIFLRGPAGSFPAEDWSDFPVVLLGWWIEGLAALAERKCGSFRGVFMDGPYAFSVQRGSGDSDEIFWGRNGAETLVGNVNVAEMLNAAIAAASVVAADCRAQGWSGRDVDSLENAIGESAARLATAPGERALGVSCESHLRRSGLSGNR